VARVIATILKEQDEQIRANVIEKWIDVAHQCRKLKNFSSLTAILNGLLSGCIYRLTTAWSHVNGDYWSILEELKNVFGSCADRKQARAILDKVRIIISIENRLFFMKFDKIYSCSN
jgi:ral guanine nucleotide dissociation stimulator-like 1